jgi:hypothetical protein
LFRHFNKNAVRTLVKTNTLGLGSSSMTQKAPSVWGENKHKHEPKDDTTVICFLEMKRNYISIMNMLLQNKQSTRHFYLQILESLQQRGAVSGYRSRGPGFDSRLYQIFWEVEGSGTRSTQPREGNWGATWMKK